MATSAAKPVVLIITGAWHVPQHYHLLVQRLEKLGYDVDCPCHPTNNNATPPDKTFDDDVQQIRNIALGYLDQGRDVVAVMHSYGGVVGSNALSDLDESHRKGKASVIALLYMAAFIPLEKESLAGIFGGGLPPWLTPNDKGTIDIDKPSHHFYNDLSKEEQQRSCEKLVVHPTAAQFDAPSQTYGAAAWRNIPVTYLLCTGDQALPLEVQEIMIGRVEKEGVGVRREQCDASHSPFLSMPGKVADIVVKTSNGAEAGH